MIRNPRNLLWLLPLFLLVSSPLWLPPFSRFLRPPGGYDEVAAKVAAEQTRHFVLDAIVISLASQGRRTWTIHAARAFTGKTDRDISMEKINALYLSETGEQTIITSNKGTYRVDKRHMTLTEDVVIRKPAKHQEMYTEILHYYDADKMVISPVDVMIKGENFTIFGGRLDYDLTSDAYEIGNHVICKF